MEKGSGISNSTTITADDRTNNCNFPFINTASTIDEDGFPGLMELSSSSSSFSPCQSINLSPLSPKIVTQHTIDHYRNIHTCSYYLNSPGVSSTMSAKTATATTSISHNEKQCIIASATANTNMISYTTSNCFSSNEHQHQQLETIMAPSLLADVASVSTADVAAGDNLDWIAKIGPMTNRKTVSSAPSKNHRPMASSHVFSAFSVAACIAGEPSITTSTPSSDTRRSQLARAKSESAQQQQNPSTSSAINDAARVCGWADVQQLCKEHPLDAAYRDNDGWTALHHACNRRPPASVIQALIEAYPDAVFWQDKTKGMTPLHYACRFKASKEVVKLLIHAAKESDSFSQVKDLSSKHRTSAICSSPCKRGRTPLWYALRYDAPDGIMELLLFHYPLGGILVDHLDESPLKYIWDRTITKLGKRGFAKVHQVIASSAEVAVAKQQQANAVMQNLARSRDKDVKDLYNAYIKAIKMVRAAYHAFCNDNEEDPEHYKNCNFDHLFQNILHVLARLGGCHIHPSLWDITTSIFFNQASLKDPCGNLPLHYAVAPCTVCARLVDELHTSCTRITTNQQARSAFDEDLATTSTPSSSLMTSTSAAAITTNTTVATVLSAKSMALSLLNLYPEAALTPDSAGRFPLHIALDSNNIEQHRAAGCCTKEKFGWHDEITTTFPDNDAFDCSDDEDSSSNISQQRCCGDGVIGRLVKCYPEALYKLDSMTGLYPFMMAAACNYYNCAPDDNNNGLFAIGLAFDLLLESPSLAASRSS